jgi:hypothetical protein
MNRSLTRLADSTRNFLEMAEIKGAQVTARDVSGSAREIEVRFIRNELAPDIHRILGEFFARYGMTVESNCDGQDDALYNNFICYEVSTDPHRELAALRDAILRYTRE